MGDMKRYFREKLYDINYRMTVHVGDANRRLASESTKIFLLPKSEVPEKYKGEFNKLRHLIEETQKSSYAPGLTPTKIEGIRNSTASKYIKLLFYIQSDLDNE